MVGTPTQHNAGVGDNGVGGAAVTMANPTAATAAGQQRFAGRGSKVWSVLTAAVKMFGPAATTQEFSKKLLKSQVDVGG